MHCPQRKITGESYTKFYEFKYDSNFSMTRLEVKSNKTMSSKLSRKINSSIFLCPAYDPSVNFKSRIKILLVYMISRIFLPTHLFWKSVKLLQSPRMINLSWFAHNFPDLSTESSASLKTPQSQTNQDSWSTYSKFIVKDIKSNSLKDQTYPLVT